MSQLPSPRRLPPILLFLLLAAGTDGLPAQSPAAQVAGVLDITDRQRPREYPAPTSRAEVQRIASGAWLPADRGMELFLHDRVLVQPRTIVRLSMGLGDVGATAHLSADLEARQGPVSLQEVGGHERGLFEIRETPRELGGMALHVARGSLSVERTRRWFVVHAATVRVVMSGTRILVSVDDDGEAGIVHLVAGHVEFPDFPQVRLLPGQTALLRAGATPVVATASVTAAGLADAERWMARRAWGTSIWQRPWIYAGVGLGALGVVQLARSGGDGGNGEVRRTGTVVLRLPQ